MTGLVIVLIGVVALLNYLRLRDYRYPAFLASALWFGALTLYYFSPIRIDSISVLTVLVFLVLVLSFTGGSELALLYYRPKLEPAPAEPRSSRHPRAKLVLLLTSVVVLPVMLHRANEIAQGSGIDNWFVGLRIELVSDSGVSPYGILAQLPTVSFIATLLYGIEARATLKENLQYYCSIAVSIIYAFLTSGRAPFLLLLVSLLGISSMRHRLSWRKIATVAAVFIVVFAGFAVMLGKGGAVDSSFSDNLVSVRESLVQYAIGAIPCFDRIVRTDRNLEYGVNTFSGVINVIRRLVGLPLPPLKDEELMVPFPINVYTAARPVFDDFGILGVILGFSVIGAISTYSYSKAADGDPFYVFGYALGLYPLALMVFADQYFVTMGWWLRFALVAYFYFRMGSEGRRVPVECAPA